MIASLLAITSIFLQKSISDASARQTTRLENLRFVRQLSSQKDVAARPFANFDLQDQNLAELDLTGANFTGANLRHANLVMSDLSSIYKVRATTLHDAHLEGANLSYAKLVRVDLRGADLTGANLFNADVSGAFLVETRLCGANLRAIRYDQNDPPLWPVGFKPPPSA